jgi:hypothetical protein
LNLLFECTMTESHMSTDTNDTKFLIWPSNHPTSIIQEECFILGWNIEQGKHSSTANGWIVAGFASRKLYSLQQVQDAISKWRKQYQSIELTDDFQIIDCTISFNVCFISYEPCNGLEYYRHVPGRINDFYEKCHTYKSSNTYDSLLMKITEAHRIVHDILYLLNHQSLEIDEPTDDPLKEETMNLVPCVFLSYFQMKSQHIPLWTLIRLLLPSTPSTTFFQTDETRRKYITIESMAKRKLKSYQHICSTSIDLFLGLLCGILLIRSHKDLIPWLSNHFMWFNEKVLRDNISWLEEFPVGFKLNVPLTHVFGASILTLSSIYEHLLSKLWMYSDIISVFIGYISVLFGCRALLAFSHDLARLSTVHISILASLFRAMFWFQFSLFNSLWHLFRGKKINILRQRSDTLEYDFMQLFLGMILFVTCLFLFTTMLVYYTFFSILDLLVRCIIMIPRICYIFISCFPFIHVFASLLYPRLLPAQTITEFLDANSNPSDSAERRYRLRCQSLGPSQIVIQGCKDMMKRI